jgi:hypothetical protein
MEARGPSSCQPSKPAAKERANSSKIKQINHSKAYSSAVWQPGSWTLCVRAISSLFCVLGRPSTQGPFQLIK